MVSSAKSLLGWLNFVLTWLGMASPSVESWLEERLNAAGADGEVFGSYIYGTLKSSSPEEVEEALLEILQGCVEEESVCLALKKEIQDRWKQELEIQEASSQADIATKEVLSAVSDSTAPEDTQEKASIGSKTSLSSEEKLRLLAQYDCQSDEETEASAHSEQGHQNLKGVFTNKNKKVAGEAQRLHREKLKAEHEMKLERDRRDRENQKQLAQERKEKEKKRTQKQERRR